MIGLIANTIINDPITVLLGVIVPLLGLVIYEIFFRKSHDAVQAQQNSNDAQQ